MPEPLCWGFASACFPMPGRQSRLTLKHRNISKAPDWTSSTRLQPMQRVTPAKASRSASVMNRSTFPHRNSVRNRIPRCCPMFSRRTRRMTARCIPWKTGIIGAFSAMEPMWPVLPQPAGTIWVCTAWPLTRKCSVLPEF